MTRFKQAWMHLLISDGSLCGALAVVLLAAAFEQRLNGVTAVTYGTYGFRTAGLLLAGVFCLYVLMADCGCRRRLCVLGGLLLTAGLPALYVLNASHEWRSGGGLFPLSHWKGVPASAYPEGTLRALWISVVMAASLGGAASLPSKWRKVLISLVLAGAAGMAIQMWCQRLEPRAFPVYEWNGLFVSRNHFGAFSCLVFPVALARGARLRYSAFQKGRLSNPSWLCFLTAGLLASAIIASGSRAGITIIVLQSILFVLIQWRIRYRSPFAVPPLSRFQKTFFYLLLVFMMVVGAVGLYQRQGALYGVGKDLSFRSAVVGDTWTMWRSRKWWGTGPGSFSVCFPYYQSLPIEKYFFLHAHCEPVQFMAEFGVLGASLMVAGFLLILTNAPSRKGPDSRIPAFKDLEQPMLLLALVGISLHSLIDFPFRHPLILMIMCIWIGLLAGSFSRECSAAVKQQTRA